MLELNQRNNFECAGVLTLPMLGLASFYFVCAKANPNRKQTFASDGKRGSLARRPPTSLVYTPTIHKEKGGARWELSSLLNLSCVCCFLAKKPKENPSQFLVATFVKAESGNFSPYNFWKTETVPYHDSLLINSSINSQVHFAFRPSPFLFFLPSE